MKKAITILICLVFLAGCQTLKVMSYTPHELSATERHKTYAFFVYEKADGQTRDELLKKYDELADITSWEAILSKHEKLKGAFDDIMPDLSYYLIHKKEPPKKPPADDDEKAVGAAVPLLAATVKLVTGLIIDAASSEAKDIIESTTFPYSHTTFMTAEEFGRCKAIIIIRKSKIKPSEDTESFDEEDDQEEQTKKKESNEEVMGMIAIIKLEKKGDSACQLTPAYVLLFNSAAQTEVNNPLIDITFAIAVKGIVNNRLNYRELRLFGQAAVTVGNLNLDDAKNNNGTFASEESIKCNKSDLIPLPNVDKPIQLSVSISVVEKGKVGFGLEKANAEISAIKEAIGGGVSGMITERFD